MYLAADNRPLTREQICLEACRAPRFAARKVPKFTGSVGGAADHGGGGLGKIIYTPLLLFTTTTYHYLLTTTYYYVPLLTTTYHYLPLLTTTYHYLPLPGKIIDSTSTRTAIGWQPKYTTFGAFIDTLV